MGVRRGIAAAAVVALSAALGACGPSGTTATTPEPGDSAGAWRTSSNPVAVGPLVWEADGVVRLSDGTSLDLGGPPSSYVVAGDGAFFVTPDGDATDTGLRLRADTLRASPEGRYLAGIDVESGDEDDYGTPLAEVVVLDLREGREVVRTSEGLGDTGDDLTDLYEEIEIGIVAITDDTALVVAADGTLAIDLATGDTSDADPTKVPVPGSPESPDGAWTIRQDGDRATVLGAGGDALPLEIEAPQWTLDWWADAETAVRVALNADGSSALLSCPVPEGTCQVLEDSTGKTVRFATGATDQPVVRLVGGEG